MTERPNPNEEAEDVVNDTTRTNEPGPTPADSELGSDSSDPPRETGDDGPDSPKPDQGDSSSASRPDR
jgi:hypothetical protein